MTTHGISNSGAAPAQRLGRVTAGRVWRAGLLAATVAAAANAIVFLVERTILGLPLPVPQGANAQLAPLTLVMVVVVSLVVAIAATLLLAILNRFVRRPLGWFRGVSAVVLLLSFGGPLSLPVDTATKAGLAAMHLVAAAAIVGLLTGVSRIPKEAL
jgi:Family of unknown function (DUF6069)